MTVLEVSPAPPLKGDALVPSNPVVQTVTTPDRRALLLVILGLLGAVFLVYGQTVNFDFVTFDDGDYVADNWNVRQGLSLETLRWAFTTFAAANWHPLTWLSLTLDFQLYGLNAGGYHLTNVLLHAAVTVGVFLWLRSATGAFWRSAFVAGLMALHPLHVESVAWVAERKDVLSAVFFVATLAAYTRWVRRGGAANYALTLGLYVLGLMAKPMLVTLPAVLLLLDGWPLGRLTLGTGHGGRAAWWRCVWEKTPFFALSAVSCVVTFIAQRAGGAVVPLQKLTPLQRLANAVLGYGDYLRLTVVPSRLSIFYPGRTTWPAAEVAASLAVLVLITLAALRWRRTAPAILIGWCWFLGMLVPVIGLVQVGGQAIADRYTYLPHIGLFVAFTWGVGALAARWQVGRPGRLVMSGAAAVVLLACGMRAWEQTWGWRDSFTMYHRSYETAGPTTRGCQLLADAAINDRYFTEAERWLKQTLALTPNEVHAVMQLGTVRLFQGRWEEAARLLGATLPQNPNNAANFNNFGLAALRAGGHNDVAERAFDQSLQLQPADAPAHFNLAELKQDKHDWAQAVSHYESALTVRPDWPDVLLRVALLRATCADPSVRDGHRALACALRASTLMGGNVRASLDAFAAAYAELGRWPEAVAAGEAAVHAAEVENGPDSPTVQERRKWLELYRSGQPLRL